MNRGAVLKLFHERVFTLALTLLVVCGVAAAVWPGKFPKFENISMVLLNISIETIVAVGMMVLMISGAFDLSVGSVVAFSGGIAAHLMYYYDTHFVLAIAAGMGGAVLVGLINGVLIAKAGINPMIQTLAMMGIVRGGALMVCGAGLMNFPAAFNRIGQTKLLGLQSPIWIMLAIVAAFSVLVAKTVFFRRYYYIGGNERAARLSGIRVARMRIMAFVLSAALAGVAGILLAARLGAAMSRSGQGVELRVITAVILGGASLRGGQGKIVGAFLGAGFMGLVKNIMIIGGVGVYWQEIVLGTILILAVGTDILLKRRSGE
ncbi:MAG: ABC transporter permease [Kiritimatiellae bacterium]|nr:ABC transporter permease [Kiritimatiellia bacterium]